MILFQRAGETEISLEYSQYCASFALQSLFLRISHILTLSLSAGASEKISTDAFEGPVKASLVQTLWFVLYELNEFSSRSRLPNERSAVYYVLLCEFA